MKKTENTSSNLKLTNNMDGSSVNSIPRKVKDEVDENIVISLQGLGSNDFVVEDDDQDSINCLDQLNKIGPWFKHKIKKSCTKKMLLRRIPILTWVPKYTLQDAVGDLVAGITVGLTVIPQSLAYSNVAGLPAEYGLYGSFLGCFIYILFGSCKDVPMGPTAIISLLTFQAVRDLSPSFEYAILLCFTSGVIELLMGIFGLGFIIDFVSGPVSSGFTSAVALIIVTSQIKDLIGITASGTTFLQMWISIFREIGNIRMWDTILGVTCIVVLLVMRLVAAIEIGPKDPSKRSLMHKILNKGFWLFGTSRNAILVIICGMVGYVVTHEKAVIGELPSNVTSNPLDDTPFKLMGYIPPGLPALKVPPFGFTSANGTTVTFIEMVSNMGSYMIVLPLVSLLENIAICKAFSTGKPVDATQELIAIGLCNIGNSFVQAFPGTGSLSRSAVNEASGVRTPLGGLYTGILVIVALCFLTPFFWYIPKASLAAIIIAAVVFMVEIRVVKPMWRTKKSDLIPGFGTFIACLVLRLELGILLGIIIQILFLLYNAARPKLHMQRITNRCGVEYLRLTPDRCLIFPSVDYVRNLVTKHSIKQGIPVVIDCSHIYGADYTAAKVIESLTYDFAQRKQLLFFYNLKASVLAVFEGLQPPEFITFYEHDDLDELLKEKVCLNRTAL